MKKYLTEEMNDAAIFSTASRGGAGKSVSAPVVRTSSTVERPFDERPSG